MTHVGRRRNTNEDHFLVAELLRRLEVRQTSVSGLAVRASARIPQGQVMAVADGMGGHAGGGLASGLVVDTVAEFLAMSLPWLAGTAEQTEVGQALDRAFFACQERLQRSESPVRLATTLTVAYVSWPHLWVAHVGGSRCYLFRQGDLQQLTHDHTPAERRVDNQHRRAEGRSSSPLKDVLWSAVGEDRVEITPDLIALQMMKGDSLLLCTDGLNKHVSDRTIAALLAEPTNASPTCERLLEAANAGGGSDNITVVVARYG